ncbi:MAG: prepilin-type N-terminal cleavage/methylation domain-containing protein [Chthoniobacterales bacterium]
MLPAKKYSNRARGFSLVEVTIALGLVVFVMTAVLGLLPIAMRSVQESALQQGVAAISLQIQGNLQQIPFSSSDMNSSFAIDRLSSEFYTRSGRVTDEADAYYRVDFTDVDASLPGSTATYDSNLRNVKATISWPMAAPETTRKSEVLSLLIARQTES